MDTSVYSQEVACRVFYLWAEYDASYNFMTKQFDIPVDEIRQYVFLAKRHIRYNAKMQGWPTIPRSPKEFLGAAPNWPEFKRIYGEKVKACLN